MSGNDERTRRLICYGCKHRQHGYDGERAYFKVQDSYGHIIGFVNPDRFLEATGRKDKVNPKRAREEEGVDGVRYVLRKARSFKCQFCGMVCGLGSSMADEILIYAYNFLSELENMEDDSHVWEF